MTWDPRFNRFEWNSQFVAEAIDFVTDQDCLDVIEYFNKQDTSCGIHPHTEHTPNNDKVADFFSWSPSCLNLQGLPTSNYNVEKYDNIFGITLLLNQMKDAATRYTNQPMTLAKVVFHRYTPGSVGPEHTDVWPVASLLYFNDDYEGGELYFPNQNIEISPSKRSLYVFEGGGDHMHGVKKITSGYRYVLVAFWEFEDKENLQEFWNKENQETDRHNGEADAITQRLKRYEGNVSVLYAHSLPIFEIKQFIDKDQAELIEKFLSINDDPNDECWGPICFREYWDALGKNPDEKPIPVEYVDEYFLQAINERIKQAVEFFLETDNIEFSKFKGHNHKTSALSPPHGHPPASAVAILALNEDYVGGELTIPKYDISFKLEQLSLYIFKEGPEVPHGVSLVGSGQRHTLVSHWQPVGHHYDLAGASSRRRYRRPQ